MDKKIIIPDFNTKKELFDFLQDNQQSLIAQKRAISKEADSITIVPGKTASIKAKATHDDRTEITVTAIINTTNIMDSHGDVHLPGLWNKSLSENKMLMHLQEHKLEFDKIIADGEDLKAFVRMYSWKELGFDFDGQTQALVFESIVKQDRNAYMFDQYKRGNVRNHSVGMRYVKLTLALNDEERGANYEAWQKYYPEIVNKQMADQWGYFWAVKEAMVIEGSAVPIGSNIATPTQNIKSEPLKDTLAIIRSLSEEPFFNTPGKTAADYNQEIINALKI